MIYAFFVFILTVGGDIHVVEAHETVQECQAHAEYLNNNEYFKQHGRYACLAVTNDNGGRDD